MSDWDKLKQDPKNANRGTGKGTKQLERSIKDNGVGRGVVAAADGTLLAGNKTADEAKRQGKKVRLVHTTGDELVVTVRDDIPDADDPTGRAIAYADNRVGEQNLNWDLAQIEKDWSDGVNLEAHWNKHELDLLVQDFTKLVRSEVQDFDDVADELPGAKALKPDMLFESDEPYEIPPLRKDMLAEMPDPVVTWAGPDASADDEWPGWWLYNYGSDSIKGLDLTRAIMAFYVDDYRFANWFTFPDRYVIRMLNAGMTRAVVPNFSLILGIPKALNIFNSYQASWLGRYMQEAGIKVIPDIAWTTPGSFDYCFAGIPKYPPVVCMQVQTSGGREYSRQADRDGFLYMLDNIAPDAAILYGAGGETKMFFAGLLPDDFNVVWLESRSQVREQKIMSKGIDFRYEEVK